MSSVKVQLIKRHTHAGIRYEPGDVIEVTQPEFEWLKARQIVTPGNKDPKAKPATDPT